MKFFYGYIIVFAGFLMNGVALGSRHSFGVFFKSMEADFGLSRGVVSGLFSIFMVLSCIAAVLGGWVLDRKGPRKVVMMMGVFTGLSMVLTSQVHTPWVLLFTYSLLLSMGTAPSFGLANTTSSRWFVKGRGLFLGITASGEGFGAIVFAPFAAWLISNFNWRIAFLVIGVLSGLILLGVSRLFFKDPGDLGLFPDGEQSPPQKEGNSKAPSGFSFSEACRTAPFWQHIFAWLLMSLSVHMISVHVVPYAVDAGIKPMDAALIISLIGFSNIPGRLITGRFSDAYGRKALAVASLLLASAALFYLMNARKLWMLYIFGIIFGFLWGGGGTMLAAMVSDTFGMSSLGSIMGMMSGAWAMGAAIGPAVGGYLYDASGSYSMAFGTGAAALLLSGFLVLSVKRAQPRELERIEHADA